VEELRVTVALNDAAAHARVLAARLQDELDAIARDYPNNSLGGGIERLRELALHAQDHAQALTDQADKVLAERLEAEGSAVAYGVAAVPPEVMAVFGAADLIRHPLSEQEAGQATTDGRLVVLRDPAAQAGLVVNYGAIFAASVDPALVRLWWPRVLSNICPVAIMQTEVDGVWRETTLVPEAVPA